MLIGDDNLPRVLHEMALGWLGTQSYRIPAPSCVHVTCCTTCMDALVRTKSSCTQRYSCPKIGPYFRCQLCSRLLCRDFRFQSVSNPCIEHWWCRSFDGRCYTPRFPHVLFHHAWSSTHENHQRIASLTLSTYLAVPHTPLSYSLKMPCNFSSHHPRFGV